MKIVSIVAAILLSVIALSPALADDADTMNPKDAELQMLRSSVKRQAEVLEPLQTRVKAQDAIIEKLNDELTTLKNAALDADVLRAQLARTTKELEDVKQLLAARDNQLSEVNAKLLASQIASGKAVPAGGIGDPIKAEFVASFEKFATKLQPAFTETYKKSFTNLANCSGQITNFKSDVISTNSAVNPLLGIVEVACTESNSFGTYLHIENLVITMRFTRANGYWRLIDATNRSVEVVGGDGLGIKDDKDGGAEVDFSQAPAVTDAVIAVHGLLPKK